MDYEIMHAAIKVLDKRSKQIDERDDELYHYGRKGMKWGEDIFAEDEESRRRRAGAPSNETGAQKAARLKKELLIRRAEKARSDEGADVARDRKNADYRKEINKSPNKAIYAYTGVGDDSKQKVNYMMTNAPSNPVNGLGVEKKNYNNEVLPPSQRDNYHKHYGIKYQSNGAVDNRSILENARRAGYNDEKPEDKTNTKPEVKVPNSEYYKKKYGGIGKGSDYANKKMAEEQQDKDQDNNKNVENANDENKVDNNNAESKKASSVQDIATDAYTKTMSNINSTSLMSDIPSMMLNGESVEEKCAELDDIINKTVDEMVLSSGLSYDDPEVVTEAVALKDKIVQDASNTIVNQYYLMLNQQQMEQQMNAQANRKKDKKGGFISAAGKALFGLR